MCFSATASFVSGAGLCAAGVASYAMVKDRMQISFASIPVLFGVQQITEGFLWLSLNGRIGAEWLWPSALVFLIFAQVIWPSWVSLSVLLPERNKKRRFFISGLLVLGLTLALYHTYCLIRYPIAVSASAHHIDYLRDFPGRPAKLISVIYVIVTMVPLFVSSVRGMKLLGTAVFISFLIAIFLYREFFISAWCFFAAIVSIVVVIIMYRWEYESRNENDVAQLKYPHLGNVK